MTEKEKSNAPDVTNDSHIMKMKALGMSDEKIAAKLGMSTAQVQRRVADLIASVEAAYVNGAAEFINLSRLAVHQYQLLGATLGMMTTEVNNMASADDLRQVIIAAGISPEEDREKLIGLLNKYFIILRPFILPEIKKVIEDAQKNVVN